MEARTAVHVSPPLFLAPSSLQPRSLPSLRTERLKTLVCAAAVPTSPLPTRGRTQTPHMHDVRLRVHPMLLAALLRPVTRHFDFDNNHTNGIVVDDHDHDDDGNSIVNQDKRIVGIGYNGFPMGCSDDDLPWARQADDELDTKYPVRPAGMFLLAHCHCHCLGTPAVFGAGSLSCLCARRVTTR